MSQEAIRVAIATAVEAAKVSFVAYPLVIEYDNRIVANTATQTNPFLTVEVKFISGEQMELANDPHQRVWGQIVLAAAVPIGSGSSKALTLLDHFAIRLHRKQFGAVRTKMASPSGVLTSNGWAYHGLSIPFWADQAGS